MHTNRNKFDALPSKNVSTVCMYGIAVNRYPRVRVKCMSSATQDQIYLSTLSGHKSRNRKLCLDDTNEQTNFICSSDFFN